MSKARSKTAKKVKSKRKGTSVWGYVGIGDRVETVPCIWLLKDFIETVKKGEKVPQVVNDFMVDVAEGLLAGKDMRKELLLSRARNRPRADARNVAIAKECLQEGLKGTKLTAVYTKVAKKHPISDSRVKKIYEEWRFQAAHELGVPPEKIPSKRKAINRRRVKKSKT